MSKKKKADGKVYWIVISDVSKTFDSLTAFAEEKTLDRQVRSDFSITTEDRVLGYCSDPIKRVMFEAEVIEDNVPESRLIDDSQYSKKAIHRKKYRWIRLRVLRLFCKDNNKLTYNSLKAYGLNPKDKMRGPRCLNNFPELYDYVLSVIDECTTRTFLDKNF